MEDTFGDGKPSAVAQIQQLRHERDMLAKCIGEGLQSVGMTAPGASLTGPHLIQFLGEFFEHHKPAAAGEAVDKK